MTYINGVNLLPATGEFTYDTVPHRGLRPLTEAGYSAINTYHVAGGPKTDFSYAIDQLRDAFPDCRTVALIVAWFGSSTAAASCRIYPSTTYIGGSFERWDGSEWVPDRWRCSGLTELSPGLVPISSSNGRYSYGGTPSDPSVVRAIQNLKARGFRVVFYPFILMDCPGYPWRGRISYTAGLDEQGHPDTPDMTEEAAQAIATFLGSAALSDFTREPGSMTVTYRGGGSTDFTYRRMILHYANLCVLAGGVDLFLIGSELRGLEMTRGPSWTPAGSIDGSGHAVWDYPFVEGLVTLSNDVRGIFDAAGLAKDPHGLHNLISYAADWSAWMGIQHNGANPPNAGQWPHLDRLYGHPNIDLVCFDNYLPLSDWTTGAGGLDAVHWSTPRPSGSWPPSTGMMNGLGLTGSPALRSKAYLKANIEGGEKFDWFYAGPDPNLGRGLDPLGSGSQVSRPSGDRLDQIRSPYHVGQELLANKQLRWWWNSNHKAVYDDGSGSGTIPHGPDTAWVPRSKSVAFTEYGYPSCDKCTNQPNTFFDPKSSESTTPFWSEWRPVFGGSYVPKEDPSLATLALQAVHEYWFEDGNNEISETGLEMIQREFCSVWAWDARPFPTFPRLTKVWGDASNWLAGNWIEGKRPSIVPNGLDVAPPPGMWRSFPTLVGQGWSVKYKPVFTTTKVMHVSGRETRASRCSDALLEIELTFDVLRMGAPAELEALAGFFKARRGRHEPFTFTIPDALSRSLVPGGNPTILCRFEDDELDLEEFMDRLWRGESVKIRSLKGE